VSTVPLIGGPKLSDAPLIPDSVIGAYLGPLAQGIASGASFAQPVTLELLIIATALRDLQNLRAAVTTLKRSDQNPAEYSKAWQGILALLPEADPLPPLPVLGSRRE
jgi:hypothetical protein